MDEIIERFERIASQFEQRVQAVPADAWDHPSPCEGWSARDVVGHLVEWIPGFFGQFGVTFPAAPSVAEDPVAAWIAVHAGLTAALADPDLASREVTTPMGTDALISIVDQIVVGDLFTHTWDLARATGLDERLDPDQLRRMSEGMASMPDELLRGDGMFGPPVDVADDADEQTRFLAFLGRRA